MGLAAKGALLQPQNFFAVNGDVEGVGDENDKGEERAKMNLGR